MKKKSPSKNHEARELDQALENYASMATHVPQRDRAPYKAWLGYGAASAAMVIGSAAEAAVMFSTDPIIGTTLTRSVNGTVSTGLDIDGDSVDDFNVGIESVAFTTVTTVTTGTITLRGAGASAFVSGNGTKSQIGSRNYGNSSFVEFDSGDDGASVASAFSGFAVSGTVTTSSFGVDASSGTTVVGVKFDVSSVSHFGWIRLGLTVDDGPHGVFQFPTTLTILQAGWEDVAGAPAHVSENTATASAPGTAALLGLGLLALGASGVRRFRRERKAKA